MLANVVTKVKAASFDTAKAAYQLRFSRNCPKTIGLIIGVQRSGTGMLNQAFDNDWNCKAFGEHGGFEAQPGKYRLKPYREAAEFLRQQRAPLVIAKPIIETQWAERLVSEIGAKIIWAYRHYEDVAISGQEQFGSDAIKFNLKSVVENQDHWYAENMDAEQREIVARYYGETRPIYDLRVLGWYVRNLFVFRHKALPLTLSQYETLVSEPREEMRRIYSFLGTEYPGDHIVKHIHSRSVKRGTGIEISDDIRELGDSMFQRLKAFAAELA